MVKDAEAHAADDRRFHEMVTARNQEDNMIHAVEKSLKELGDKVQADEKKLHEDAIAASKEVMNRDDKDAIETKTAALAELSGKLAERMYAEQPQKPGAAGGAGAQGDNANGKAAPRTTWSKPSSKRSMMTNVKR